MSGSPADLQTDVIEAVALDSGFAVVTSRVERTTHPVLLVSTDGESWRDRPVDAVPQQPGQGSQVHDAVADGDDLWLLVRTTTKLGADTCLVVQSTR